MSGLRIVLQAVTISYEGEDRNPLETADGLSLSLMRIACPELAYAYDQGRCVIRGRIGEAGHAAEPQKE